MFSGKLEEYLECIATYRYSGDLTEEVRLNKSKLLSLLNGIALLLVSNAKKDVAAVSHALTQTSTDAIIQVYYCKNSGCTDKDRQMVDKLVTLCRHLASNQEEDMFGEEMWSLIASHCRHKIDRRGAKVASAWKLIEDVTLDFGIPTDDGFELLREITDDSSLNKDTWGPWLRGYLASFNERLSSHQSMQKTVGIASVLLEIRKVNFQISEILRRRLRKLTQYTKVVASLKLDIRRYNRRGLSLIIRTSEVSNHV